jgi:phospholipase/carboxylesterase
MRNVTRIGELTCTLIDDLQQGQRPSLIVVLCHGYGASGDDLVDIGRRLLAACPELAEGTRFVFPHAPLTLDDIGYHGGRAWWHLDVQRLVEAVEQRRFRDFANEYPDGLSEARHKLLSVIKSFEDDYGLDTSRIVLGGFSQGAMLTTDVALHLPTAPAGLFVWSGTLICEKTWRELAAKRGELRVLQSHGHYDPILPFEAAETLRDLFAASQFQTEFIEFGGMHEIPAAVLERALGHLKDLIGLDEYGAGTQ